MQIIYRVNKQKKLIAYFKEIIAWITPILAMLHTVTVQHWIHVLKNCKQKFLSTFLHLLVH